LFHADAVRLISLLMPAAWGSPLRVGGGFDPSLKPREESNDDSCAT